MKEKGFEEDLFGGKVGKRTSGFDWMLIWDEKKKIQSLFWPRKVEVLHLYNDEREVVSLTRLSTSWSRKGKGNRLIVEAERNKREEDLKFERNKEVQTERNWWNTWVWCYTKDHRESEEVAFIKPAVEIRNQRERKDFETGTLDDWIEFDDWMSSERVPLVVARSQHSYRVLVISGN